MVIKILFSLILLVNGKSMIAQKVTPPYDALSDLSDSQRIKIAMIQSRIKTEMPLIYKRHVDSLIYYHNRMKTPFLIERDTSNLLFRIRLFYEAAELEEISALLSKEQREKVYKVLQDKIYEFTIFNFSKYKQRQEEDNLCWAACLQMGMNFNGILGTQKEIVQLVQGGVINQGATFEDLVAKIRGFHSFFNDNKNVWMADVQRVEDTSLNQLFMSLTVIHPVTANEPPFMISGANFLSFGLIGIYGNHLCLINRMTYKKGQQFPYFPEPILITYYDPLLGKEITFKWEDASKIVTDWFIFHVNKFGTIN